MGNRTRIVCTLGPASDSGSMLKNLLAAGMDVARIDCSHGTSAEREARIERVQKVARELDNPCAVMLDTRGPKIRTGKLLGGKPVLLRAGDHITLTEEDVEGDARRVGISCRGLAEYVEPGTIVLLDDGAIELAVDRAQGSEILCTVQQTGNLGENCSVALPGTSFPLPVLTPRDCDDLRCGIARDIDFVAVSKVVDGDDVRKVRMFLEQNGGADIKVVAKIETADAIENIEDITEAADGVMIVRGSLSLHVPGFDVPYLQKQIIRACARDYKPVIVGTQLLDSMRTLPAPSRAEVADVAAAIYDGADAVVLSRETATGTYPVTAVQAVAGIAEAAESHLYTAGVPIERDQDCGMIAPAVGVAAVRTAESVGALAIVTPTSSGRTARLVSTLRPRVPIYAIAGTKRVARSLQVCWGVTPLVGKVGGEMDETIDAARSAVLERGLMNEGDLAVFTAGDRRTAPRRRDASGIVSSGTVTSTNVMFVAEIKDDARDGHADGASAKDGE